MITGLRGLAQAFVRGAVAIGRSVTSTYESIVTAGFGYAQEQFEFDFFAYDQQKTFIDLADGLDKDHLIPGIIHGKSPQNLTCEFKYDVKGLYSNVWGDTITAHWSVISDQRMTQTEVMDAAQAFIVDSVPEDALFYHTSELEGIWTRKAIT